MFFRMIKGAFGRQWKKMLMIAMTIALGASLATAMLNVMMDVGDKVNQELKTYGANIMVVPKSASVVSNLYEIEGGSAKGAYLLESELGNIKTIFWAFNIVDFTPFLDTAVTLESGEQATIVGTWFNHHLELPTGETLNTGLRNLRTWWDLREGEWLDEQSAAQTEKAVMVGETLAKRENIHSGDIIRLSTPFGQEEVTVRGIFNSGDSAEEQIFAPMAMVQTLADKKGYLTSIEVSALTTPDNELAVKAAKDPSSLTIKQYELWYCTAYVSSICYQIQDVITDSVASPVRQVADSEGAILEKIQLLMVLITILSLAGSALGITNLVTASVMERSSEIGLLKAIGAKDGAISALFLTEIAVTGVIGAAVGYLIGFGFAQIIGQTVFGSPIEMKLFVIPLIGVLVLTVILAGSIPAIRMLLRLRPAEVLHGR
ncbi:ABC transporter permease [Lachnospiraceae bacterium oral taxon 500]|nr:ABC transporter permease [Lachnospiraceae bacterium oral taxon 500]